MYKKCEVLHGGRPRDEEPHVKKSARRKKDIDYILKVDLVRFILPFADTLMINLKTVPEFVFQIPLVSFQKLNVVQVKGRRGQVGEAIYLLLPPLPGVRRHQIYWKSLATLNVVEVYYKGKNVAKHSE